MSQRLARVLWLGGSPCSGKSTVADRIAQRFGLRIYDCDEAWFRHGETAPDAAAPVLHWLARATAEEIWLQRTVDLQVADAITSYRELFPYIVSDLCDMPGDTGIVAVGAALLPEFVSRLGVPAKRSLWMVPTESFQRHHYGKREWRHTILRSTSDPDRAWENWMLRDAAFAGEVIRQARHIPGRLIVVDGSRDVDSIEREVVNHFGLIPSRR